MAIDKIFYNEASAKKMGWDPSWFGCDAFDEKLVDAIKAWQRSLGIVADGVCGPVTYRRIWTEREATISKHARPSHDVDKYSDVIIHNGNGFPIKWGKVVLWDQPGGLKCQPGTYTSWAGAEDRKPTFFVNHWDVCLTSASCASVLANRGISVHFCIDNDGTIYQLLDTQHRAWHAGGDAWNTKSIGVEVANAYYTKYQDWYIKNGYGPRPVVSDAYCHGTKVEQHLGFYPVQLEAMKALWVAVHGATGIPMQCPIDASGKLVAGVDKRCEKGQFQGFINHYNLTTRKVDCAGVDLVKMMTEAKAGL